MFIVSLAVADLIVGLIAMPISAVYILASKWIFGLIVCEIWLATDYIASTASILNLFILSLDRYWSVTSPLQYMRKRTKKRALILISCVWTASALWIVPIIGWHHFEHGGVRTVAPDACDTEYAKNTTLKIITGILNFYLPLSVMYSLYGRIFSEIRKRSALELGQRTASRKEGQGNIQEHEHQRRLDSDPDTFADSYSAPGKKFQIRQPEEEKLVDQDFADDDINWRVQYSYDETVLDPTTERVQRFIYEERCRGIVRTASTKTQTVETSLSHSSSTQSFKQKKGQTSAGKQTSLEIPTQGRQRRLSSITQLLADGQNSVVVLKRGACRLRDKLKSKNQRSISLTKEIKAARQLGVIMGAFTLCFLPYFVCFMVVAFCDGCVSQSLMIAMTWIGYLNSTLNPLLYPLCNANFRRKFRKMLCFRKYRSNLPPAYANRLCKQRTSVPTAFDARYDF